VIPGTQKTVFRQQSGLGVTRKNVFFRKDGFFGANSIYTMANSIFEAQNHLFTTNKKDHLELFGRFWRTMKYPLALFECLRRATNIKRKEKIPIRRKKFIHANEHGQKLVHQNIYKFA
jgi:hypothetical protein